MKIRNTKEKHEKIEVPMTPMIDIVFQLLIFFIMTFKIVDVEGDFNIKMPEAARESNALTEEQIPPMRLIMKANTAGDLVSMRLAEQNFSIEGGYTSYEERTSAFSSLGNYIVRFMGNQIGPGGNTPETVEIEIDADFNLKYEYTIQAITMISGRLDNNKEVVPLVEKIQFAPPRPDPNAE